MKKKTKFRSGIQIPTRHLYHLVDPSPWPIMAASSIFMLTVGIVAWVHSYFGGLDLFKKALGLLIFVMLTWWRDVIREATFEEQHNTPVNRGLRLGMILFIVSEVMFFFSLFWAFFHSSLSPVFNIGGVWPPKFIVTIPFFGIPLTNTFFLLSSGATITWAHHALVARAKNHSLIALITTILLALLFTALQRFEYLHAPFNISDSIFGSCFYLTTGFHGFHVFIGTVAIFVALLRVVVNHFTTERHFGFESSIWYWHFVDIVWIFLLGSLYWWGQ